MDTGWKPNVDMSPNCPRCGSSNTKFCYYNNYSLTQPRYFCKGCRRYWTKGGSLRNVPVGGGCRKNRRGKSLRLSSDHHHHHHISNRSKSCPTYNGTNSSSSSTNSDGSHIDLALVYANFLNPQQQQESKNVNPNSLNPICMQEFGGDFDPYFDFANLESNNQQIPNSAVEVGGLGEIESEQLMYYSAMDSMLLAQNKQMQPSGDSHRIVDQQCGENRDDLIKNGLPPLPGEEGGASMWSDQDPNQSLQVSQPPEIGPETHQDPNSLLFGNWCPF